MKKQLVFSFLFAFTAMFTVQAQALTSTRNQSPEAAVQKIRQTAEQHFGVFNTREYDRDRDDHCDCHKCQKGKKSKKHDDCKGRGNHYGKHKNKHGKHSSCCCENRKNRDCDDDNDRWGDRNSRRDRDDDRRYTSGQRDRDDEYRTQPQPTQRKPTSTAKVKTRPSPTAKPAPSRPGAKRTVATRPVGVRQ